MDAGRLGPVSRELRHARIVGPEVTPDGNGLMANETWLIFGIVVLAAVAIAWLVARRRVVVPSTGFHELEPGWQFYGAPTTLEPPGTIFRIDHKTKSRFIVTTLSVKPIVGEEAFGRHRTVASVRTGVLVQLLGLAKAAIVSERTESLELELGDVIREDVADEDVPRSGADARWNDPDSDYYLIRSTRSARGVTYIVKESTLLDLGGEATIREAQAQGKIYKDERTGNFTLKRRRFKQPMRIMFLPEKRTRLLAIPNPGSWVEGQVPQVPKLYMWAPVTEPLEWVDEHQSAEQPPRG